MPKITVEHLNQENNILRDISFVIEDKSRVFVIGPEGAGKSALLNCLAGLEKCEGVIRFDDEEIQDKKAHERKISMIFSEPALFTESKVKNNIIYGMREAGYNSSDIQSELEKITERFGIRDLLDAYPSALSESEKHKVAFARALIRKPELLLVDNPFENLEEPIREYLENLLVDAQEEYGFSMIQVTKDQSEAMRLGNKILVLSEGELMACDTPRNLYENPVNLFTAEFIGTPRINTFASSIEHHRMELLNTTLNIAHNVDDQMVVVGIRPEDIIVNEGGHFSGIVTKVETDENSLLATIQSEFGQFFIRTNQELTEGERIFLSIRKTKVNLFDIHSGRRLGAE